MWVAVARSGLGLAVLSFLMFVVRAVLNPIVEFATSGPNSDAASVVRIESYFALLTVENLTLIAAVGVAVYLLGRAAVERRVG